MRSSCLSVVRASLGALVAVGASAAALATMPSTARASGPVERMVQILEHPSDPNVLVVRWGLASEGFLYSKDGGKTFRAQCSYAMDQRSGQPKLRTVDKVRYVEGSMPSLLDGDGKVTVAAPLGALYADDGAGCGWSVDESFGDTRSVVGLARDPRNAKDLIATGLTKPSKDDFNTTAVMMRRTNGKWSVVGPLRAKVAGETTAGGELLASPQRLYSTVAVNRLNASPAYSIVLTSSTDNGATWREVSALPSGDEDNVILLGLDPSDANRILAVNYFDSKPDVLLASTDGGKTFKDVGKPADTRGVAFAPDGRVFVADAGDASGGTGGGLWVATRLGDAFKRLDNSGFLDCIGWDKTSNKLRVCEAHRFGLMDPTTGAFQQLTRLDKIESLVECAGSDTHDVCGPQLNAGPSWCCTGHYSFTPFCSDYDVTNVDGKTVYCGKSGQQYDLESGRTPEQDPDPSGVLPGADGGTVRRDAGTSTGPDGGAAPSARGGVNDDDDTSAPAKKGGGGGCAVEATPMTPRSLGGALLSIGALLLVLGTRMRRRR